MIYMVIAVDTTGLDMLQLYTVWIHSRGMWVSSQGRVEKQTSLPTYHVLGYYSMA